MTILDLAAGLALTLLVLALMEKDNRRMEAKRNGMREANRGRLPGVSAAGNWVPVPKGGPLPRDPLVEDGAQEQTGGGE